jgi:hypothetical protein
VRRAVGDMVEEIDTKRRRSLAALQRGLAIESEAPLLKRGSRSSSRVRRGGGGALPAAGPRCMSVATGVGR